MDLNQILSDHGFGGGQGLRSSFGNGSDGAFNPSGTGSQTNNTVDTLHNATTIGYAANTTIKDKFSTSWPQNVTVTLTGVTWAASTANPNSVAYLWDSQGNLLGQTSPGALNATLTFTSPIQLQPGQTYNIGIRGGDSNTMNFYEGQANLNVAQTVNGATFTLGLNSYTWYGTPAAGTMPPDTSTQYAAGFSLNVTINNQTLFTFSSTQDGPAVVKQFTSVNIPANVMVSVTNRCKGLIMLVQGDVTINGAINMDGLAALADPTDMTNNPAFAAIDKASFLYDPTQPTTKNKVIVIGPGGTGGVGGAGSTAVGGGSVSSQGGQGGQPTAGTWWGGGRGGGGGGAGANSATNGANGGDASWTGTGTAGNGATNAAPNPTAGTGGAGGGGASAGTNPLQPGGNGGLANGAGGGGGGGSINATTGTAATSGSASSGGAGGLILIIAKGNITLNSGAVLSAKGSSGGNGGNGGSASATGGGGGGGGAGGGVIALLYKGTFTNSGATNVQGGAGGIGGTGSYTYTNGFNGRTGQSGQVQAIAL